MQFDAITGALSAITSMAFASPAPSTANKAPEHDYIPTGYAPDDLLYIFPGIKTFLNDKANSHTIFSVTFYNQPKMAGQQLTVSMKYSKDHYRSDCTHSPELRDFTIASAIIVAKERSLLFCTVHKDSKYKDPIIVIKGDIKRVEKTPSVSYVQCALVGYDEDKRGDKHGDKHGHEHGDKDGEKDGNKDGDSKR
jgi:hypothetical protein